MCRVGIQSLEVGEEKGVAELLRGLSITGDVCDVVDTIPWNIWLIMMTILMKVGILVRLMVRTATSST